ncbi:uncharacterized protein TNIN_439761 [Trichonephila inaurata madagascariensis]|uniref:Uncharacterized protein n=1 Tax=Trichonephila inaurata madagascariensis TaxID=2747483 RepID=A0A8X6X953_9ARAC|nr:uncharacterized protein TNIN_439761 [Trichonephila inaurata madagascariensis]
MQYKTRKPKCTGEVCLKHQPCVKERRSSCTIVHIELVTSWPVTVLWILLSWLVSTLATTAYVHPEWFVREHYSKHEILNYDRDALVSTMGMVSVCYRGHDQKDTDELECHNFDEDFPSSSWQTSYVLFGSGCVLLTWCSILAFCNIWIIGKKNRQLVAMLIGRIQLVADPPNCGAVASQSVEYHNPLTDTVWEFEEGGVDRMASNYEVPRSNTPGDRGNLVVKATDS